MGAEFAVYDCLVVSCDLHHDPCMHSAECCLFTLCVTLCKTYVPAGRKTTITSLITTAALTHTILSRPICLQTTVEVL